MNIKSKKAKLDKIADSVFFHEQWEKVQKGMGKILSEAHNPNCTMNDWIDAYSSLTNELNRLRALGWSVRHGATVE